MDKSSRGSLSLELDKIKLERVADGACWSHCGEIKRDLIDSAESNPPHQAFFLELIVEKPLILMFATVGIM